MKKRRYILHIILVASLALLWSLPCAAGGNKAKPASSGKASTGKSDRTIAVVNGARIYESDLHNTMEGMQMVPQDSKASPEEVLKLKKTVLEQLIGQELLYQDSLTLEIKDIDKKVDEIIAQGESQLGSREKLMEQLAKEGLTLDKVRRNIRKNLLVQAVVEQKILPQVKVTDEDIQSLYQANQDKFKHDETVGARHILIQVPKEASEEQKKAAQEKIASLRKELVEGKDFAEMAKANSNCPSRTKGGDLGYFEKGNMVPEFANAAFSLKEGEISEIVETSFGYHLIQVYGKKPAGTSPLEEVRDQVEKEVQNRKAWEAITAYIQKLQKSAKIQILDKSLAAK